MVRLRLPVLSSLFDLADAGLTCRTLYKRFVREIDLVMMNGERNFHFSFFFIYFFLFLLPR